MRPFDYLRILARRWWILVLGALIGSLLGFVTQPSQDAVIKATAPKVQFRATNLMLVDPTSTSRIAGGVGFDRLSLLTITGQVRDNSVAKLHATRWANSLAKDQSTDPTNSTGGSSSASDAAKRRQQQQATADSFFPNYQLGRGRILLLRKDGLVSVAPVPDPATGALKITATGSKDFAVEAANTFAAELTAYLDGLGQRRFDDKKAGLASDLSLAQQAAASLDGRILFEPDPIRKNQLTVQRAEAGRKVDALVSDLAALNAKGPDKSELVTYEPASPTQLDIISAPGGSTLSSSQRLLVGGGIGLLAGLALLVLMELLGARVRDVASTEGAARMPVIAEIPVVKMNRADRFLVATSADPASLTAEAYRSLRTSLLAMWQRHPRNTPLPGADPSTGQRGRPLRTLLVTSPGPAEGKSISVVNLAAAFAETGMTVLIVDADFRRPTQYRYLERPRDPNLGDLDISCSAQDLEAILQETDIPGVRLAASAPSKSDPGHAIAVAKAAARVGAEFADLVIVDSPPLLLANDASDIALDVDASILLARAGWTRRSGIVASADLLRRLEAPVIGVVIVGAEHGVRAGYYGYYGYYGYGYGYAHPGEVSVMQRLMPWKAGRKGGAGKSRAGQTRGSAGTRAPQSGTASGTIDPPRPNPPVPPVSSDDPWV